MYKGLAKGGYWGHLLLLNDYLDPYKSRNRELAL